MLKLLTQHYTNFGVLHHYTNTHIIIRTKVSDFLNSPIVKWKYNRTPDMARVKAIAQDIYNNRSVVDSMFYLHYNPKTNKFECYDGLHRWSALHYIYTENMKPQDLITPGDFGENGNATWLYDSYVIVNLRYDCTDGQLIDAFQKINNSCPIADIYVRDTNREKVDIIEKTTELFKNTRIHRKKFNNLFTGSNKPQRPNTNDDRFKDLLNELYDKLNIEQYEYVEGQDVLITALMQANQVAKTRVETLPAKKIKLTQDQRDKCDEIGCYLFVFTSEDIIEMV